MNAEEYRLVHEIIHRLMIGSYLLGKATDMLDDAEFSELVTEYYRDTNEVLMQYEAFKNMIN